jgi:parallel beta-helix repeat protein
MCHASAGEEDGMTWEARVQHHRVRFTNTTQGLVRAALAAAVALILMSCGIGLEHLQTDDIRLVSEGDPVATTSLDGQVVSGTIHILVEVNRRNVAEVHFHHNDAPTPLLIDHVAPFELVLDTTSLEDGRHLIVASTPVGRGGSNQELARAEFTVRNHAQTDPPEPPATAPGPEPEPDPDPVADPVLGVRIGVGDDVRAVVRAHPAGTTFVFAAGVHRFPAPITPRQGDTFVGEAGAVLSGSRLLTSFEREGGLWVAMGQRQEGWRHPSATCASGVPRCQYPEDLFLDDVPLRHVGSLSAVGPGSWFFDYGADRIYFADDPTGRKVEASVTDFAFHGDADDVTIRGLTIEKFANPPQRGVILARVFGSPQTYGHRWVIENNLIQLNHGAGITAGHGARIIDNRVLRNGQLGINGGWGKDTLVEGNEIAYNNWAGFQWGWEAGGTKWSYSDGLTVRNNHSHHNEGPGLWTDGDNIRTLYEGNLVEHNAQVGIFHEISYAAIIRNNTILSNGVNAGLNSYVYIYAAGIVVSSSSDTEVYGNTVLGNWNGITAVQGNRGSGAYGVHEVRNLHVHDNLVSMDYHAQGIGPRGETGVAAVTGLVRNGGVTTIFDPEYANQFERNHYQMPRDNQRHFRWNGTSLDFTGWQSAGHDRSGVADRVLGALPNFPWWLPAVAGLVAIATARR